MVPVMAEVVATNARYNSALGSKNTNLPFPDGPSAGVAGVGEREVLGVDAEEVVHLRCAFQTTSARMGVSADEAPVMRSMHSGSPLRSKVRAAMDTMRPKGMDSRRPPEAEKSRQQPKASTDARRRLPYGSSNGSSMDWSLGISGAPASSGMYTMIP